MFKFHCLTINIFVCNYIAKFHNLFLLPTVRACVNRDCVQSLRLCILVSCLTNIVYSSSSKCVSNNQFQIIYIHFFQIFMAYCCSLVLNRTIEKHGGKSCSMNHFYRETPSLSVMFFIMSCGELLRKMLLTRYNISKDCVHSDWGLVIWHIL